MGEDGFRRRIACFITPHGFGHAARASAVMDALLRQNPGYAFDLYSRVPEWFFQQTLSEGVVYHSTLTDIGMVQASPLREDLDRTLERLNAFLPFDARLVAALARDLSDRKCCAVLCDIAPLGIAVAREARLPSILIENFTWDWIYEGYLHADKRMGTHVDYLRDWFTSTDIHIQTAPCCHPMPNPSLPAGPISRTPRNSSEQTRRELGIPPGCRMVLMTMGGTSHKQDVPDELATPEDVYLVIPGGSPRIQKMGNIILLPYHSRFYHPDLISAADVVIGKVGYSTVAEVFHAGVPFGYVTRPHFRESAVLAAFVRAHVAGFEIDAGCLNDGTWAERLPDLLSFPHRPPVERNGADQVAGFIHRRLA